MRRVKWLNAEWPFSMRKLGNKLKEMPFASESSDGFIIDRVRDAFIEGRFIEKYNFQETLVDPFGKESHINRLGYYSTEFILYSQYPYIEIRDSQRSVKDFLSRLLEACNFNLTINSINIDLMAWVNGIQKLLEHDVLVDSMQVSGVKLEDGIVGKIIFKGEKDVRQVIDRVLGDKPYLIEKLQIKIDFSGRKTPIHLGYNGTIKLPVDLSTELISIMRISLPQIQKINT